jgi:hypothetical protein
MIALMSSSPANRPRPLSRRTLLGATAVGALGLGGAVAGCGGGNGASPQVGGSTKATASTSPGGSPSGSAAAAPSNALGANINGDTNWSNFGELQAVSASWLRAFYPMPDADAGSVASQPVIRTLLAARAHGYRTVLSLKFPYSSQPMPTPGSHAMAEAVRRLDAVLPVVMGAVDVLIIGNEPFIECRAQDRGDPVNVFYQAIAEQVIAYREQRASSTRLYMGALNHLDLPTWRTPATAAWMAYVRNTAALDGVDIHPHLSSPGSGQAYLDYITPLMRGDQTFLATEFSLVLYYQQHLRDTVPSAFAGRYGLASETPVWQVIADAIRQPYPQDKWNAFLSACSWFSDNDEFLRDQVQQFRSTGKLAVATYGLTQDSDMTSSFGPNSTPWLLNSLFCPYTVETGSDGLPGQTSVWVGEFRALQSA